MTTSNNPSTPDQAFPPAGWVDGHGAAALLGVGTSTLNVWVRQKRLPYAGELVAATHGVKCRIYQIAQLQRARKEMIAADAQRAKVPEGYVDFDGVAQFFGVHVGTLNKWQRKGLLSRGTWMDSPETGQRRKIFAIAELERVREQMKKDAERPVASEGFVELSEAARRLGVSEGTLRQWELKGRLKEGQVVPIPGTNTRTKIYPLETIERLREEIRSTIETFPPEGWLEMNEAARRANVSIETWKRWLKDGRVEDWRWFSRPKMARCKLFAISEIDRLVEELGRDHQFFMQPDGQGGFRPPQGYVDRYEAAKMFGVASRTFSTWQTDGRITCGRWARKPVGESGDRRVYPVEEIRQLALEFSKVGQPYPDPQRPEIVRVPVMSWSKTRFEAIIDASDLPLIEGKRWNWMPRSDGFGAAVVLSAPSGEQIPMRRMILGLEGRYWRISHANGDPLDCRRENLIAKTINEQLYGTRKRNTTRDGMACTSQYKGVSWASRGKWRAQIQKEGVRRDLGLFDSETDAAQAYDDAARELFGEYARLNFPDDVDAWLENEGSPQNQRAGAGGDDGDTRAAA